MVAGVSCGAIDPIPAKAWSRKISRSCRLLSILYSAFVTKIKPTVLKLEIIELGGLDVIYSP
jgi:hypothetical protein